MEAPFPDPHAATPGTAIPTKYIAILSPAARRQVQPRGIHHQFIIWGAGGEASAELQLPPPHSPQHHTRR